MCYHTASRLRLCVYSLGKGQLRCCGNGQFMRESIFVRLEIRNFRKAFKSILTCRASDLPCIQGLGAAEVLQLSTTVSANGLLKQL